MKSVSLAAFKDDLQFAATLLRRDMASRYAGNMGGIIHAYLAPFSTLALYAVIFSFIFGGRITGEATDIVYSVYLCSGLVLWLVVAEVLPRSTGLFTEFSQILRQRKQGVRGVFLFLFLLSAQLFLFFLGSLFLLHVLHIVRFDLLGFALAILMVPLAALYLVAIGIVLAFMASFITDLRVLMPVLLQIGFWGSPITYSGNIVPQQWQALYGFLMDLNPFYGIIRIYQSLMTTGDFPSLAIQLQALVWFVFVSFLALAVTRRFMPEVADLV